MAGALHRDLPEIAEATVSRVSRIGWPVTGPRGAVQVRLQRGFVLREMAPAIRATVDKTPGAANSFFEELIAGR